MKNAEGIQLVRTWWRGSRDRRGWVGMVRLGSDRLEGLCTEEVVLNEGRRSRPGTGALGRKFSKP